MNTEKLHPRYNYDDYLNWEGRWEIIDGFPYAMSPSPNRKHQVTSFNVAAQIKNTIQEKAAVEILRNCEVYQSLDWIITDDTVVCPDIMVVCGDFQEDFLKFPPVLIIEILSQKTRMKDRNIKFSQYQEQGVKYYILADPDKESIEIFQLIDNQYREQKNLSTFELQDCSIEVTLSGIYTET